MEDLIDRYCACWRVMDGAERRAGLRAVLAEEVRYCDPQTDLSGVEALDAHIARVVAARPSARIERVGPVDAHHDVARFGWHLVDGAEERLAGSIDVVRLRGGRIDLILGFFGPLG